MRLSKSKVLCYENCPFKYKKIYIDKIERKVEPKALKRGTEIHEMLEDFYKPKTTNIGELKNEIKKHPKFKEHEKSIKSFVKVVEEISTDKKVTKPMFREIKIIDEELNIAGVIDRVDFDGKNKAIIDYKTGKVRPIANYRFELALYAYLFEKEYQQTITHIGVWFVDHQKLITEELNRKEIITAIEKVRKVRGEIRKEHFPKTPNRFCKWCEVYQNGFCNMEVEKCGN